MLNHGRTLLMNASHLAEAITGEEYVPESFRPITTLPTAVRKVRSILFGTDPDRYMLNLRLHQLMPLIHICGLEQYLLAYDSRITYWPIKQDVFRTAFGVATERQGGTGNIYLQGAMAADVAAGRIYYQWQVEVVDDGVSVQQLVPQLGAAVITSGDYTDGLSSRIPLQQNFGCLVTDAVGSRWTITGLARPTRTVADLARILKSGLTDEDLVTLFGNNPSGDRREWYNLWKQSPFYGCRLAGLLLAVIKTMDEHR